MAGGESLTTEGGEVGWYSQGLSLETSTRFGSGGGGGFLSSIKRAVGGSQLFLTEYTAPSSGGFIALAARMPGVIRELTIDAKDEFMVQSGGFMAGTRDVEVSVGLQKRLGAGIFGGAGLVFQKLSGNGRAWVALSGEIVEYDLQAGRSLLVHPAHLALYLANMELKLRHGEGRQEQVLRRLADDGRDPRPRARVAAVADDGQAGRGPRAVPARSQHRRQLS